MKKRMVLAAPCLAMLAACGGGSTGNSSYENLQNAPAGSVVLSADTPAEVSSIDEVLAVDFTQSPVGSSVVITEGDYAGISLTKTEPIGGKESVFLSSPNSVEISSALIGTLEDDLAVAIQFLGSTTGIEEVRPNEIINGTSVSFYKETNTEGQTSQEFNEISIGDENKGVSATVSVTDIADETTLVLGARRYFEADGATDDYQEKSTGSYTYTGLATVFGYVDSYTTESADMTIDFENSDGTFSATNFAPDEGAEPKTISIDSLLSLDNSTGFVSSTSGTLTVNGVAGDIAVNGVLSENNTAVAGVLIAPAAIDELNGGVFVLPKNP